MFAENLSSAYLFATAAFLPPLESYAVREEALRSRASLVESFQGNPGSLFKILDNVGARGLLKRFERIRAAGDTSGLTIIRLQNRYSAIGLSSRVAQRLFFRALFRGPLLRATELA